MERSHTVILDSDYDHEDVLEPSALDLSVHELRARSAEIIYLTYRLADDKINEGNLDRALFKLHQTLLELRKEAIECQAAERTKHLKHE